MVGLLVSLAGAGLWMMMNVLPRKDRALMCIVGALVLCHLFRLHAQLTRCEGPGREVPPWEEAMSLATRQAVRAMDPHGCSTHRQHILFQHPALLLAQVRADLTQALGKGLHPRLALPGGRSVRVREDKLGPAVVQRGRDVPATHLRVQGEEV